MVNDAVLVEQGGQPIGDGGSSQAGKIWVVGYSQTATSRSPSPKIMARSSLPLRPPARALRTEQLGTASGRPVDRCRVRRRGGVPRIGIDMIQPPGNEGATGMLDSGRKQIIHLGRSEQSRPVGVTRSGHKLDPDTPLAPPIGFGWNHGAVEFALSILALLATVLAVTALANRINFSAPLLLMLVGIGVSFLPLIHVSELSSEVVLVGFLPPLLYAAAIRTSVIDFRANRRSIAQLSVLLVVVTALGVGLITWLILPVSFPVAFALGAVVAPPDAIAATSIARRVGLPRRLVTILEGESLVNDATAITCLRVAIAAIGGSITAVQASVGFLVAALGGAAVGLAVALLVIPIRRRITQPVFDTAISLLVPWAAYLPAESLNIGGFHGSGVISVVTAGLILGHKSPVIQSGQSRLSERVNWATIRVLAGEHRLLADRPAGEDDHRRQFGVRALRSADCRLLCRGAERRDHHPDALGLGNPSDPVPPRPGRHP